MIKFYQGTYSELQTANRLSSKNNICFVTDRQVLIMGGKEYGKDSAGLKISSAEGFILSSGEWIVRNSLPADFPTEGCDAGTLFFFKGDQSILKYEGGTAWSLVQNPELKVSGLISANSEATGDNVGKIGFTVRGNSDSWQATTSDVASAVTTLENKVVSAYANTLPELATFTDANKVILATENGITKTSYVTDRNQISATLFDKTAAASTKTALSTVLINGYTAAQIVQEIDSNKVTIKDSVDLSGISSTDTDSLITISTSISQESGTIIIPQFHVLTGQASGALVNNDGRLETKFTIRKLQEGDTGYDNGYRSQYALFNEAGGSTNATRVQLGDTINLVKDQFLKSAEYTPAHYTDRVWYEYDATASAWYATDAAGIKTGGAVTSATVPSLPSKDAANRYLKFIFALSDKSDNPDTTASDTDSVVYININELFDSYTGVNGVRVDENSNTIIGIVDDSTQKGISTDAKGVKGVHYGNIAYLTVGQGTTQVQDFAVNGIKQDISASIEDLDNLTGATKPHATTNTWLTDIGVDNGRLTGAYISAYTSGVNFNGVAGTSVLITSGTALNMPSTTYVTAQDAISALALHIGSLDYTYDGKNDGSSVTKFVYAVQQVDGLVSVSAEEVDAGDLVAYSKTSPKLSVVTLSSDNVNAGRTVNEKAVPVYAITSASDGVSGSLQSAIDTIVTSVANTFADLNMTLVGRVAGDGDVNGTASKVVPSAATGLDRYEPYKIINAIEQKNGYVTAIELDLVAQTVGFEGIAGDSTHVPVSGYTVGAALSSLSQSLCTMIDSLDHVDDPTGAKPAFNVEANKYSIDNRVDQENGKISTTKITLTDDNVFVNGINGYLPGTGTAANLSGITPASGRVAINAREDYDNSELSTVGGTGKCGSLQMALINISNIIADYCSFHAADGNII